MKTFLGSMVLVAGVVFACQASALGKVNIVYPIQGSSYPITGPATGMINSAYITVSFGVTCGGGPYTVKWGFNKTSIGSTKIYDQGSEQQVWKLPRGKHVFWVDAGQCGREKVSFKVGP